MPDRFDEILEEMRRDRAVSDDRWSEWMAESHRRGDQIDENLRFLGELSRRSEIVLRDFQRELSREIRESIKESRQNIKESRERTAEIKARVERNSEASKAHTRAIFALIDRLEGGGGPALAG